MRVICVDDSDPNYADFGGKWIESGQKYTIIDSCPKHGTPILEEMPICVPVDRAVRCFFGCFKPSRFVQDPGLKEYAVECAAVRIAG